MLNRRQFHFLLLLVLTRLLLAHHLLHLTTMVQKRGNRGFHLSTEMIRQSLVLGQEERRKAFQEGVDRFVGTVVDDQRCIMANAATRLRRACVRENVRHAQQKRLVLRRGFLGLIRKDHCLPLYTQDTKNDRHTATEDSAAWWAGYSVPRHEEKATRQPSSSHRRR